MKVINLKSDTFNDDASDAIVVINNDASNGEFDWYYKYRDQYQCHKLRGELICFQ